MAPKGPKAQLFHSQVNTPKNWKLGLNSSWHTNVHSSTICNGCEVERAQMSPTWRRTKPNVVHHAMERCSARKESTDLGYNMNVPPTHCAKWKKPDTKGYTSVVYDSICTKRPQQGNPYREKADERWAGDEGRWHQGVAARWVWGFHLGQCKGSGTRKQ